ncbi:ATP-binding cassette domain-containing protein [Plantactinospora sp. B6F1]|uniref:ATP-binding cassette domain-containing protein n=1 Tax=Plantactinospora sp. B6F1 TaxID=3158971 RepID=UPI0032D97A55
MSDPIVDLRDAEIRIRRRTVVYSVDLKLSTGVTGLIGPNGAGKTTLVRALSTAIPLQGGTLQLFGEDARATHKLDDLRSRIGYAAQQPLVLSHLSAIDQVAYVGWLKGLTNAAAMRKAKIVLEQVELADRAQSRTRALSGGMLRRLGIAMALVNDPDLILLDEPTAGLDPDQRERFRALVSELGRNHAVLLSTHLLEDVASVCSNVVVMLGGRSIFQGTVDALAARAEVAGEQVPTVHGGYAALTGRR